ncbi:hypothetical protein ACLOJK_035096, partial [Asimina triloba]
MADLYTFNVFLAFQKEVEESLYYIVKQVKNEGHSVSGQVRAQKSGALKAWVRSVDVPSGSIQTRHQDPEGLFGNGARGTKSAEGCGQGAIHYQDSFRHVIRSPDG